MFFMSMNLVVSTELLGASLLCRGILYQLPTRARTVEHADFSTAFPPLSTLGFPPERSALTLQPQKPGPELPPTGPQVMLEAQASPNLVNATGETPLMLAVNAGATETGDRTAPVLGSGPEWGYSSSLREKPTCVHLAQKFLEASFLGRSFVPPFLLTPPQKPRGNMQAMQLLLDANASVDFTSAGPVAEGGQENGGRAAK